MKEGRKDDGENSMLQMTFYKVKQKIKQINEEILVVNIIN